MVAPRDLRDTIKMAIDGSKYTKDDVDYSKGHTDSKCSVCYYFLTPDRCRLVQGNISPNYWCNQFMHKDPEKVEYL